MPKTTLTAKFIRIPVDGGRIRVAPAFDDFLESDKMVVLELGMQRGNLGPDYFEAEKSGCRIPMVLNPGAFTHYSYAIKDALESVHTMVPAIEVHMSNIQGRDDFRHTSVTASECLGQISGMGKNSYKIAMEAFKQMIEEGQL